ncbi:MAG: aldo/keto reductase [Armatimonadetes bacterium]|nr:aldo/keto reductase [Armatimonadota bacterium]
MEPTRRDFLRQAAVASAALPLARLTLADEPGKGVQRHTLARLEREVGMLGCGLGSAFLSGFAKDPDAAAEVLQYALDTHGINYWDTASGYSTKLPDGTVVASESLIGPALKPNRDRVVMVSKAGSRDYDGLRRELDRSLQRLQTDHLDILHLHAFMGSEAGNLDAVEEGAVRAARKAKEEGLIKAFGITGHDQPDILMACIRRFEPDAVMTIFPSTRPVQGRFETELAPLAVERKMALIAMKAVRRAQGSSLKGTDLVRYAMSVSGIQVTIVGLDSQEHLDANAAMATSFQPMTAQQRERFSRYTRLALGEGPAPWELQGYRDGVV